MNKHTKAIEEAMSTLIEALGDAMNALESVDAEDPDWGRQVVAASYGQGISNAFDDVRGTKQYKLFVAALELIEGEE